jgi:hypothetical protein
LKGIPRVVETTADAATVQFELYRRMTPAEKARRVSDLTRGACQLALAGLRQRHPKATEGELLLRLAVLRLGMETVGRVYGRVPSPDGA